MNKNKIRKFARSWAFQAVATCVIALSVVCSWTYFRFGSISAAIDYLEGKPLSASRTVISLGDIGLEDSRVIEFRIQNHSDQPITLVGSRVSCSCISIDSLPSAIFPRQERVLPVRFKNNGKLGVWNQKFVIFSDSPTQPEIWLKIEGNTVGAATEIDSKKS